MDDIFSLVRDGNALQVRIWLDNTENDLNQGFVVFFSVFFVAFYHFVRVNSCINFVGKTREVTPSRISLLLTVTRKLSALILTLILVMLTPVPSGGE